MEPIAQMIALSRKTSIPLRDIEITAIRAQGPGGQHVNKAATGVHLRFDVRASSLPDFYKERLLQMSDRRITKEGVIVIKAQQHRNQEQNREEALRRLADLIRRAVAVSKKRKSTRPTRGSQRRRLEDKSKRGRVKALRQRIDEG